VNNCAASHVVLFVGVEPVHEPPKAVFFDPSGRRQRGLTVLLLTIALIAAVAAVAGVAVGLQIIGRGGGQPPRISVKQSGVPSVTGGTPDPPFQSADLPPLPTLPAIPRPT
jgi:hypothetical protein